MHAIALLFALSAILLLLCLDEVQALNYLYLINRRPETRPNQKEKPMPAICKQLPASQGQALSNRYRFRRFTHSQDMHAFLSTGGNSLEWKESAHDLKSGVYRSQVGYDRAAGKAVVTFTKA